MGVKNYLIDGVSCAGKTTVCDELQRRGYHAIHGDRELAYWGDPKTGEPVTGCAQEQRTWMWNVAKVSALVADQTHAATFFCGGSRNSDRFIDVFDAVFVLEIDLDTLNQRLAARPEDAWGGSASAGEAFARLQHATKAGLPTNAIIIDAAAPLSSVVDTILEHAKKLQYSVNYVSLHFTAAPHPLPLPPRGGKGNRALQHIAIIPPLPWWERGPGGEGKTQANFVGRVFSPFAAWPQLVQNVLPAEMDAMEVVNVSEIGSALRIGRRVVVTGMAGAGKSTFARQLAAKTGLPVIHLDVHFWKPGWVEPSDTEWRAVQSALLAGEAWIADGNYHETLDLRLERADTVVYLDTPWWVCAARAFVRGLRRPEGQLPDGCEMTAWRRLRDEWWLVWRVWLGRRSERERELAIVARQGGHAALHVLRSKGAIRAFLDQA